MKTLSCSERLAARIFLAASLAALPNLCVGQDKPASPVQSEARYHYDTAGVQLDGTVTERKVYGPPGYGETPAWDERSTILVLKLPRGIAVEPVPDAIEKRSTSLDSASNVREVQLFISSSGPKDARNLVGKRVAATGTLNEAITASQYTKVWMYVQALTAK
jgi:hypothetical protein